ncbi:RNA methyltransferase [Salmonella enterica]|nr:RNA methyltransferase [Salmonella enterica]
MTITKERLLKIQHWRETYGADSNVMLPAEEAEELARIALAALEAEKGADPVVFTDERNLRHIARGRETSLIWGKQNQEVGDIPLYRHAQPAPVVPEEKTMPNHLSMYAVDAVAAIAEVRGWNACRAAMLKGKGE